MAKSKEELKSLLMRVEEESEKAGLKLNIKKLKSWQGGSVGKESAYNAGDPSLIRWLRRSPGEGIDYPLQYSCLANPMDRGAWRATVHGVAGVGHH